MGILFDALMGRNQRALVQETPETFAVDEESVPPDFFGLTAFSRTVDLAARIDRRSAIQVGAVKRSRDLIAGTLGTLPVDLYGPDLRLATNSFASLLAQPERNVTRSVTMTRTYEDLFFEGVAWWLVEEFYADGFPRYVKRANSRDVSFNEDTGEVQHKGKPVSADRVIKFDSPNDALLVAGARAIRTCLLLDEAAANFANGVPPMDFFTPLDDTSGYDDDEVQEMLDGWQTARLKRGTAFVPAGLKYEAAGWDPKRLQLREAREAAVLEVARTAGIDSEEVNISTTSRTYFNSQDRRLRFVQSTLQGYMSAVEGRLSMNDVNPRGYEARTDLTGFLRSDDKTRFEGYALGLQVGAITHEDIARWERQPAVFVPAPAPALAPAEAVSADV